MAAALDATVEALGEGRVAPLASGGLMFKLDSYPCNPIVRPADLGLTWRENGRVLTGAVFNGGAELLNGGVVLTPRCQQGYRTRTVFDAALRRERATFDDYVSEVWPLVSDDGVTFRRLGDATISGDGSEHADFTHGIEDLRILRHDSRYLLVGTGKLEPAHNGSRDGDRIAVYSTADFHEIDYLGMVDAFDTRNAVPLLEPVSGREHMLIRFYPDIHLDALDCSLEQLLSPGEHAAAWQRVYERRHRTLLLEAGRYPHEREKIGPAGQVIRTDRGWLMLYHSVGQIPREVCEIYGVEGAIERGYSICAALLAPDDPRRVLCRTRQPIYIPSAPYELYGDDEYPVDVPAVVFPVGSFVHGGKLLIYAGAGDKYLVLLSCSVDALTDYLWEHCRLDAA